MAWRVAGNFSNSFATRMRPLSLWESPHKTSAAMVAANTTMSATQPMATEMPTMENDPFVSEPAMLS